MVSPIPIVLDVPHVLVRVNLCNMLQLCINFLSVHGFTRSSFDGVEGGTAYISFQLNVKGSTRFPTLVISGTITEEPDGTASENFLMYTTLIRYQLWLNRFHRFFTISASVSYNQPSKQPSRDASLPS